MEIKKESIKIWCEALRSGEYIQGTGMLHFKDAYCCLGVACDIFIPEHQKVRRNGRLYGFTPDDQYNAPSWLKLINSDFKLLTGFKLSVLNDSGTDTLGSFTFNEIADLLEAVYVYEALN